MYLHYEDDELEQMGRLYSTHEIFKKSKIMVGKPVSWKNCIKVDLTKTGCDEVEWSHMTQHRVHWRTVMQL